VAKLTDYLDVETLRRLQEALSGVADRRILLRGPGGEPLTDEPRARDDGGHAAYTVPIKVGGTVVGRVELAAAGKTAPPAGADLEAWARRFVRLVAELIGRLHEHEREIRSRAEELAAVYRLTGVFTEERDLQKVLDLVAKTVVEVLGAKACSIRLLNEDRTELLSKAVYNLSPEYLDKGPVGLDGSAIDREVLSTLEPIYIPDEPSDPRVLYPDESRREGIVSALCAPLAYKGRGEGVLRVYTGEPHEFDWYEVSLVKAIAAQAAAAIVNARLYAEAVEAAAVRRQLALAGEVQRRMVPASAPRAEGFDIAGTYVPSYELGGDFYDFIELGEGNLGVAICDVVGKGVRASLLMSAVRASLRGHAANIYEMSLVLDKVNRDLCADTLVSDFATLFYGVLSIGERRFTYANAGHIPPLLVRGGQVRRLGTGGVILGIDPKAHYTTETLIVQGGDVLVAYTDGLADALDFAGEPFGHLRIEEAVREAVEQGFSAEATVKHVVWNMRKFTGLQVRLDDLTMVAIRAV
jgi:serine phosphatase RsbU (regulator of sigma subunit)